MRKKRFLPFLLSLLILCSSLQLPVDAKEMDASLVVGIYDEAEIKMGASRHAEVITEEKTVKVNIEEGQLPDYYYVKGFLADPETYEPYCTAYEPPNYTKEM